MTAHEVRRRFARARVARLATVGPSAAPHLVPITFALLDEHTIVTAVDHKPKRTQALKRLANIAANPAVAVLVDDYDEDWDRLWWARADGAARVVDPRAEPELGASATRELQRRYAPYEQRPPVGALIVITVERWSGWSALS